MVELTEAQRLAVERSPHFPAHLTDPVTLRREVLLRADDFEWVRGLLRDEPDAPRRRDPRTGTGYALLPEERYERFKTFFEEDPLTDAEKQALLRETGRRAGWNNSTWNSPESP